NEVYRWLDKQDRETRLQPSGLGSSCKAASERGHGSQPQLYALQQKAGLSLLGSLGISQPRRLSVEVKCSNASQPRKPRDVTLKVIKKVAGALEGRSFLTNKQGKECYTSMENSGVWIPATKSLRYIETALHWEVTPLGEVQPVT
ncbi:hypothetical protein P7K49_031821, partial [Saguinus oedipus]